MKFRPGRTQTIQSALFRAAAFTTDDLFIYSSVSRREDESLGV